RYAGADTLLFQPGAGDVEMFFTNIFSFAQRRRLAEHAYQATRADLRAQRDQVAPLLARHGLVLRDDVLDDPSRTLVASLRRPPAAAVTHRLLEALDDLDRNLGASRGKPARARRPHASGGKRPRPQ